MEPAIVSTAEADHRQFLRDAFRARANDLTETLERDVSLQGRFRLSGFIRSDAGFNYYGPGHFEPYLATVFDCEIVLDSIVSDVVFFKCQWNQTHDREIDGRVIAGDDTQEDLERYAGHLFTLLQLHALITEVQEKLGRLQAAPDA